MTVLVTAASKYGATGEIARAVGAALTEHGVPAVVLGPEEVREIGQYDAVVLGSAVHAGHWLPSAMALAVDAEHSLRTRPSTR